MGTNLIEFGSCKTVLCAQTTDRERIFTCHIPTKNNWFSNDIVWPPRSPDLSPFVDVLVSVGHIYCSIFLQS